MVRVKVCGLTNLEDAQWAADQGADFLGFVLESSSPRFVAPDSPLIAALEDLPPLPKVGVFGKSLDHPELHRFDLVQSWAAPGLRAGQTWWPVLAVAEGETVADLLARAEGLEIVLLDPLVPGLQGGTGKQLDLGLAEEFVASFPGKVILAGGLNPQNVAEAVSVVKPWGVDASSGLEKMPGEKDRAKVADFIARAKMV